MMVASQPVTLGEPHCEPSTAVEEEEKEELVLDECVVDLVSDGSDSDYYGQFSWPDETDDDRYFHGDNDDLFVHEHLDRRQLTSLVELEISNAQRATRLKKKIKAKRQIKSKHARSIRYKSHNEQLYIHHRLYKKIVLDPPSYNYLSASKPVPVYSIEDLRSRLYRCHHPSTPTPSKAQPARHVPAAEVPPEFRAFTLTEQTIPNEPSFDDAMVRFLLDMQNRDLSPEDYEMLLRLDERVQRKTVNKSVFDSLLTVNVNETYLNDQCTICMENYVMGQSMKRLPCSHMFHCNCIETYLKNFSTQCPLDNLPIA